MFRIFPRFVSVLCIFKSLLSTDGIAQIKTPQTPTFQSNFTLTQPWTPSSNNQLTPNNNPTGNTDQTGNKQFQSNPQKQSNPQGQLEEIYKEMREPNKTDYANVKYDLPSCATVKGTEAYRSAFVKISDMAFGQPKFNIKEANFIIENAYFENKGNFQNFDKAVKQIGQFLNWKMDELGYNKNSNLAKNLILYRFFADTLEIKSKNLRHNPITYDFEDYMGDKDWTKMFVEKLLSANSGQCHSLPLLYLILADEIGAKAQLSYSPSHTYIKFQDDNAKWHNVELTSGVLTTDAFVLQSGYIKAEALQNKIYMQPLTEKQMLSHCLFDLAKGYSVQYCYDAYVEKVISKAIELDPNNINAQMLMSDYKTLRFQYVQKQLGVSPQNIHKYPKAKKLLDEMHAQYAKIDNLGYENMPSDAYEKWLNSVNSAKQQQASKQLLQNLNSQIINSELRK